MSLRRTFTRAAVRAARSRSRISCVFSENLSTIPPSSESEGVTFFTGDLETDGEQSRGPTRPPSTDNLAHRPRLAALREKLRSQSMPKLRAAKSKKAGTTAFKGSNTGNTVRRALRPGYKINNSPTAVEARSLYVITELFVTVAEIECPRVHFVHTVYIAGPGSVKFCEPVETCQL